MMQIYSICFDTNIMKINAEVINLTVDNLDELDIEINQILNSSGYDYFNYSEEIVILVDDQGLFKAGNPLFEITSEYGDRSHLAGRLLFVRNIENEFSTDIESIKYEDIFKLRTQLQIQLIGMTKGE